MIIKRPKPTKAEIIRYILAAWDPCRKGETVDYLFYSYEAETLAQNVRKNSKPDTISKRIQEVIDEKLKLEGCEYTVDTENARRVAETILNAINR